MGPILLILIMTITTVVASPINQIYLILPHSGSAGAHKQSDFNCLSWQLTVETNNLQKWDQIPHDCLDYVGNYMLGQQYRDDFDFVTNEAYEYAKGLNLTGDGKDIWVFDMDETTLSNIPYYTTDKVAFAAPAIPGALTLYNELINLGSKIVFLTGTGEAYTEARTKNLKDVGYTTWEKLIFKGTTDGSALVYKSTKRHEPVDAGYRIRGNMGDQWSDLLGSNPSDRTFEMPDPMYYIG